ncbi:MAG: flagellar assembly protein FliH [Planctomycetes bacterium]|nr:flagellar assembly protein FliH [Planctomycetota bacterium]
MLHAQPSAARVVAGDLGAWRERRAFARGLAQGKSDALGQAAGALNLATEELEAAHGRASKLAVEMALEIARVLLRREAQAGNYDLEKLVRETLANSGVDRGRCVVHVHPDDAKALESITLRAGTVVEADDAVARGNVQVSTPRGLLVREFEQALDAIGAELRGENA